jgi:serine/threonine-protein kinase HipA
MEEFTQVLGYEPRHKYGKGLQADYSAMLSVLNRFSGNPSTDVQEFVRRFVAFILMGNTDAHLKNWAVMYPDGVTPQLTPLYDPVCVTAFFDDVAENEYALNRAIDAKVRALSWEDVEALLRQAAVPRTSRLLQIARSTVRQAQSEWPKLLEGAPVNMQRAITERLSGGVTLAK